MENIMSLPMKTFIEDQIFDICFRDSYTGTDQEYEQLVALALSGFRKKTQKAVIREICKHVDPAETAYEVIADDVVWAYEEAILEYMTDDEVYEQYVLPDTLTGEYDEKISV